MKKTTAAILFLAVLLIPAAAFADNAAATFEAKCKSCHGPDGSKLAKADLASAGIQGKADDELVKYLLSDAKHKSKIADEAAAKEVVKFLRTLKK